MSPPITHESAFESSIEAHLLTNGWHTASAGAYRRDWGLHPDELVAFVEASQKDAWDEYVRHQGEANARRKFCERVANELSKRGTVDVLRRGVKDSGQTFRVAAFKPASAKVAELSLQYQLNRLALIRQLHHSEHNPGDSVDLALFVNGIPVATAELKNPLTNQDVSHAEQQYRHDRNPADLIFKQRTVVHFAVDPDQVTMTTKLLGPATRFLPFNTGSNGPGQDGGAGNPVNPAGYRTAYLWEQVWQPDNWLRILGEFVHVEDGRTLFPRFHQWHAVQQLLDATRVAGPGTNRLVQHSAGSGKSNTIAWLAHGLSRLHTPAFHDELTKALTDAGLGVDQPVFDKVVVITDRKVLDRQLQATVSGFEHVPGSIVTIDQDSQQLKAALEGTAARIIVTTLQKFPVVAAIAAEQEDAKGTTGTRFAVIVDEAHSSASGEAVKDLKSVLTSSDEAAVDATDLIEQSMVARGRQRNLAFFAFTATPKPKTLELFGELTTDPAAEPVRVPFHLYSMRQAIAEGFIMDVLANYTTYSTYFKLSTDVPDDREVPVGRMAAVIKKFVSLHATNLDQKAEIIVEHFREHVRHRIGGRAKAMVVTKSRLHALRYHQALTRYIDEHGYGTGPHALRSLVAFSGSLDVDGVVYTEAMVNGFPESQLPKRFESDDYQVLIVAEKYQTGFDQPLLHTMYVDKVLGGVAAVQTLSRLNRIHPDKSDTFVLDFENSLEDIETAFAPYYTRTTATPTDPNLLYDLQRRIEDALVIDPDEMRMAVTALLAGKSLDQGAVYAALHPAVDRYAALPAGDPADGGDTSATRYGFRSAVSAYISAYAFLAQVMSWTDPELEELYVYLRALRPLLKGDPGEPLPQLGEDVLLTHLRTEKLAEEAGQLGIEEAPPLVAFTGGGEGKQVDEPTDLLSSLIQTLNEQFGMNLTDADRILFEQQKAAILEDPELKVVALHNDREQYQIVLDKRVDDIIIDRHEANGVLFDKYFMDEAFQALLRRYFSGTYDEFREHGA